MSNPIRRGQSIIDGYLVVVTLDSHPYIVNVRKSYSITVKAQLNLGFVFVCLFVCFQ